MDKLRLALPLLAVTIAGCAPPYAGLDPGVTLTARLAVSDHEGRRLLEVIEPWVKSDIAVADLKLYTVDATTAAETLVASQSLTSAQLDSTITFNNLRRYTDYKILTEAHADTARTNRIDNYAVSPTSCTTTFSTTNDNVLSIGSVALTLRNRAFSGTSSNNTIGVVDGQLDMPSEPESITVGP